MAQEPEFASLRRQQFRRYFQPSRIVLGVFAMDTDPGLNVITLCFNMYCSYKPPMMAFSVHNRAVSYNLAATASECVLAIPGENLAEQTVFCGTNSAREINKFAACGFAITQSDKVKVPGIAQALGNIELKIVDRVTSGDHMTIFGEVRKFGVNEDCLERCLVSVGPNTAGYRVLARKGLHRVAVVDS